MKRKLGETLLALGAVDELQLNSALALHRKWGMPLGRAVVESRFCTPEQVLYALSLQTGIGSVDLDTQALDASLATLIPRKVAEQHRMVPLRREGARFEVLVVAIAAPASLSSLDAARVVSRKQRIVPLLATDEAIERAIGRLYGGNSAHATRQGNALPEGSNRMGPKVERPNPILIYGWPEPAARSMAVMLAAEGLSARVARTADVLATRPSDVVVAPLPALEQLLLPTNPRLRGQLIVAAKRPAEDASRAARVGAKAMLSAPVDPRLLFQAIRECRAQAPAPLPAARA